MIYKYASETKQWETITTTTRKFEYAEYNECYTVLQSRKRYEIWYSFIFTKEWEWKGKKL